jgi:uncharacterized protein (TIGR02302 family)
MTERNQIPQAALDRLRWPLRLTQLGLWAERLTQCFWPVWSILFAIAAILGFGLQDMLPVEIVWAGTLLALGGLVWFLFDGVRRFRRPTRDTALDRLDRAMPGRPITALRDTQAVGAGDAASASVWCAHVDRMAARAAAARPVEPDLRLARRDPFALRYVALLGLVMALGFGSVWRVVDFGGVVGNGAALAAAGPTWEGWVQPPAYTGKPSLYLNDITGDDLTVPVGSHITLRLYGNVGALTVDETVSGRTGAIGSASAPQQDFTVVQNGKLGIEGQGGHRWIVTVQKDLPPSVTITGAIERAASGEMRLPFHAKDDYGVTRGKAVITLDMAALDRRYGLATAPEHRDPIVLDLPLPLNGSRADFSQVLTEDLSKNAWANLPVKIALSVEDAAGNTGSAPVLSAILPGRRFFDPLAEAVIEMRRDLLWSMTNATRTDEILRAITWRPEGFIRNEGAYLQLRVAIKQLDAGIEAGLTPAVRDQVAETLWQVALKVEDGTLSDALEKLRQSQDRLSEAIRRGASKEEIAGLMQDMKQALQNYMAKKLAENKNGQNKDVAQNPAQKQMTIDGDQMQQLMDRLQQLMEQGRTDEAQALLDRLRQLTENMQVAEGQNGMQVPGGQAMKGLSDTLRKQQSLSDQAFQNLQNQFNPGQGAQGQTGQSGQPGDQGQSGQGRSGQGQLGQLQPGANGHTGLDAQALADRQKALRNELNRQAAQSLPGDGTADGKAARDALARAGQAMDQAEQALRSKDLSAALDHQAEAMDALRQGLHSMDKAMAQGQPNAPGTTGQMEGATGKTGQIDPLGRQMGQAGSIGTGQAMLQGKDVYRRAREILDEIRRRSSDQTRSTEERDYLRRLLQLF